MATHEENVFLSFVQSQLFSCANLLSTGQRPNEVISHLESLMNYVDDAATRGRILAQASQGMQEAIQHLLEKALLAPAGPMSRLASTHSRIPTFALPNIHQVAYLSGDHGTNPEVPLAANSRLLLDPSDFDQCVLHQRQYLGFSKRIKVSRSTLLQDMVRAYETVPDLIHHHIQINFINEQAVDHGGPTKEGFRLFWEAFISKHCNGRLQKVPKLDARLLETPFFSTAGRILLHGLVTVGYWPWQLSLASVCHAVSGSASSHMCLHTFMDFVSEDTKSKLESLMDQHQFHSISQEERIRILSHLESDVDMASAADALKTVETLARTHLIWKPHAALTQLAAGMRCFPQLCSSMGENALQRLRTRLYPTPGEVTASLRYSFSEDRTLRELEERAVSYLQHFIQLSSRDRLRRFLVFCTASDHLNAEKLKVDFNSTSGLQRRPTATTCSSTLNLSRLYISQEDFDQDMASVIEHERPFDAD